MEQIRTVMSVLFYHAHLGFPGGYVGVDVFFVISGFLITSLLVRSMTSGTFSYVDFWECPALAAVTLYAQRARARSGFAGKIPGL